jgi:uncharacterized protein (DUF4415 family)
MSERKRNTDIDLKKIDEHVITPEEYDEIPELTEEWFARATLHIGGKPVRRGRPKATHPKEAVNLRLSPQVLKHFRAGGRGWQTRINAVLDAHVARQSKRRRKA